MPLCIKTKQWRRVYSAPRLKCNRWGDERKNNSRCSNARHTTRTTSSALHSVCVTQKRSTLPPTAHRNEQAQRVIYTTMIHTVCGVLSTQPTHTTEVLHYSIHTRTHRGCSPGCSRVGRPCLLPIRLHTAHSCTAVPVLHSPGCCSGRSCWRGWHT